LVKNTVEDMNVTLLYHQKYILSMLWNAAKRYSSRKRMQRKSEWEEENELGFTEWKGSIDS
jgi:hypothetical protein